MKKAIFLDRDGTIIEEVNYLSSISQVQIFPFAFDAIKIFNYLGFYVFIVTNQSGVSRGYFNENFVHKTNKFLINEFKKKNAIILDYFFCPHHPDDNCNCRKPKTGMIKNAVKKYNIDLHGSFIIGDSSKDAKTGININLFPIQVLTGHGKKDICNKVVILPNLYFAALFIKNIVK